MKRCIEFVKLVGAGNDFVLMDNRKYKINSSARLAGLARKMCDRKFGCGADGLLVLERSDKADARMRIFNADGSEAEMCGNGARCFAYFFVSQKKTKAHKPSTIVLQTQAGLVKAAVSGDNVTVNLTAPHSLKLDIPLKVSGRMIRVSFINTGVPHAVVFVEGLASLAVDELGRQIRYHERFAPRGTNVNFVEVLGKSEIMIRTYERGVEGETLACGTGSTAAALVTSMKLPVSVNTINVRTRGGEVLKVYFEKTGHFFRDVRLEGKVSLVYKGEYYV